MTGLIFSTLSFLLTTEDTHSSHHKLLPHPPLLLNPHSPLLPAQLVHPPLPLSRPQPGNIHLLFSINTLNTISTTRINMYSSPTATLFLPIALSLVLTTAPHCHKTPLGEIRRHPLSPGAEYSELEDEESDTALEFRRRKKERKKGSLMPEL